MNAKLNPILAGLVTAAFFAGSAYAADSLDTRADITAETSIKVSAESNKTVSIKGSGEGAGSAENRSGKGAGEGAGKGASALGSGEGKGKGSAVTRSGAGEGKGSGKAAVYSVSRVEQRDTTAEYVSSDTKQRSDVRAEQADTRDDRASSDTKQRLDIRAEQKGTVESRVSQDAPQRFESGKQNIKSPAEAALRSQLDHTAKPLQAGAITAAPVSVPSLNSPHVMPSGSMPAMPSGSMPVISSGSMPSGSMTGNGATPGSTPSTGGPAMNSAPNLSGSGVVSGSVSFSR